ncbi:hypothetical protein [Rhodococcus sp. KBW08]|uniref:hypothetical protein n=1 Tax=Rhodococcus sp. KBW08 TaxID=2144188 RepID=UPI000F59EA9F|nr:hypothetical protein [Rhodococcus sp. KBW08]
MDWVGRELSTAATLGATTGAAIMVPVVGLTGFLLPAIIGAAVGLVVGLGAVAGGRYALATARVWPARSHRSWKHRFALCSTVAVLLIVAGAFIWAIAASGELSPQGAGFPGTLFVLAAILAVSYVCAYGFAPYAPTGPKIDE